MHVHNDYLRIGITVIWLATIATLVLEAPRVVIALSMFAVLGYMLGFLIALGDFLAAVKGQPPVPDARIPVTLMAAFVIVGLAVSRQPVTRWGAGVEHVVPLGGTWLWATLAILCGLAIRWPSPRLLGAVSVVAWLAPPITFFFAATATRSETLGADYIALASACALIALWVGRYAMKASMQLQTAIPPRAIIRR